METKIIYAVIPSAGRSARLRALDCAAFAAARGQRLRLVTEVDLMTGGISPDTPIDGFFVFADAEADGSCLKSALSARFPRADIYITYPADDEFEIITDMLAYWPSRRSVRSLHNTQI